MGRTARSAKRLITFVVGGSILLLGIAMLVLPGPAFAVIPIGIVILAGEFAWARHLRKRVETLAARLASESEASNGSSSAPELEDDPIEQQSAGRDRTE